MKFEVDVCRIGYATRIIEVEADTREEANDKAIDMAGGLEFSEHHSDYVTANVPPTIISRGFTVAVHDITHSCVNEIDRAPVSLTDEQIQKLIDAAVLAVEHPEPDNDDLRQVTDELNLTGD